MIFQNINVDNNSLLISEVDDSKIIELSYLSLDFRHLIKFYICSTCIVRLMKIGGDRWLKFRQEFSKNFAAVCSANKIPTGKVEK